MSEHSQGPGWWQASDLRWYPPEQQPAPAGGSRGRRWMIPSAAVIVIAVIAAAATFLVAGSGDEVDAATVALEPVQSAGPDPFTASVAITEVAEFPDEVRAVTAEVVSRLTPDAATGTLVATGDTPGLYGGTRDEATCDSEALSTFLADNDDKASAWAGVAGIGAAEIPEFLDGLTSVVLTADTWVTNHGFADGAATPRSSVLQAGTAALVDDTGTPRVRCSCGNPLSAPPSEDLSSATTTGTEWSGYSAGSVAVVAPGEVTTDLTVIDVATGDTFQAPVGAAVQPGIEPVTEEELRNLSFTFEGQSDTVTLEDGVWTHPTPGFGGTEVGAVAIGDLDGDGVDDGVMVVASNGGGNSVWTDVIVVLAADRTTRFIDFVTGVGEGFGPSAGLEGIVDGLIVLDLTAYIDSDPRCCPSLSYVATFGYEGDGFVRVSLEPR